MRVSAAAFATLFAAICCESSSAQDAASPDAVLAAGDDADFFPEIAPDPVPEEADNLSRMIFALRTDLTAKAAPLSASTFGIILRRGAGWPANIPIKVCFRDGTPALQREVATVANDWNFKGTPLKLDFGNLAAPRQCPVSSLDISVSLTSGVSQSPIGPKSQNGVMLLGVANIDPTTVKFRRIVLHEFGHALGLLHEMRHTEQNCWSEFDLPKLKAFYLTEYKISDEARIKADIGRLDAAVMNASLFTPGYDRTSVMMYMFPAGVFRKKDGSPCFARTADHLSSRDEDTVRLAYSGPVVAAAQIAALSANEGADTIKLANAFNSLLLAKSMHLKSLEQAARSLPPSADPGQIADAILARSQQISAQTFGTK
jgi:hypothetical protein